MGQVGLGKEPLGKLALARPLTQDSPRAILHRVDGQQRVGQQIGIGRVPTHGWDRVQIARHAQGVLDDVRVRHVVAWHPVLDGGQAQSQGQDQQ